MEDFIFAILLNPVVWYITYLLIKHIYKKNKHKQRNLLLAEKAASYEKKVFSYGFLKSQKNMVEKTGKPWKFGIDMSKDPKKHLPAIP